MNKPSHDNIRCFQSVSVALALGLAAGLAPAQTDPAAAQKNLEQLGQQLRERVLTKPLVHVDTLGLEAGTAIQRLVSFKVQSHALAQAVELYWQTRLGQAVSIEQIQTFHSWFYDMAARQGLMAYARTDVLPVPGGEQLLVQIMQPKINAVRVLATDNALAAQHAQRVQSRLGPLLQPGMPLDTLALDQALDSASHDLPIELAATLRSVGPELLDLMVTITPANATPGQVSSKVVQLNSHGLKQYGRTQVLGAVTVGMPWPKSQLSLLGQASEGLAFARADYEALLPAWGARWTAFGTHSRSHSVLGGAAATQGSSSEVGLGLQRIHGAHRDLVFKSHMALATRHSESRLQATGVPLSDIRDHQIRWHLTMDNERLSMHPVSAELELVRGQYPEAVSPSVPHGAYTRAHVSLKGQAPVGDNGSWHLKGRLRGQWANRNLESYNQMALGGVNGVRAYTSADGVGDHGVLGSLELTQALTKQMAISAFYDVGQVEVQADPLPSSTPNRYTLQGTGLQLQGHHADWQYTLTWAKGLQGYKGWLPSHIESSPNNHRVNLSLSYRY